MPRTRSPERPASGRRAAASAALTRLATADPTLTFQVDSEVGLVRHIRGRLAATTERSSEAVSRAGLGFVASHPELFGEIDVEQSRVIHTSTDAGGGASVVVQQFHGPARVHGGSARFHVTRDGALDAIDNRLMPDLHQLPREPRVTTEEAIKTAQQAVRSTAEPLRPPELLVHRLRGRAYLVWEIRIRGRSKARAAVIAPTWVVRVDAIENKVIQSYDDTQTAEPSVGAGHGYYSGTGALNTWNAGAVFQLRDTTRTGAGGAEIHTKKSATALSDDADNNWNDLGTSPRSRNQGAEVDCHRYVGAVLDYFAALGRNSFDGAGAPVEIVVHAADPESGEQDWGGARWNPDDQRIEVGDGDGGIWDYCCAADWLGHELTHGYIQKTCGLDYNDEPGALNEAICDTFAAFITKSWLRFSQTWKPNSRRGRAKAYRNLADPHNGGRWDKTKPRACVEAGCLPSHYAERYDGLIDNGGVHINSAMIGHAFHLLTQGGTHKTSKLAVRGVGQAKAERVLFLCMSDYLIGKQTASFTDFRAAVLDACHGGFPGDADLTIQAKNAFNAVGVGPFLVIRHKLGTAAPAGAQGAPGTSPDVINRRQQVNDPKAALGNAASGKLCQDILAGQDNFLYVRVANRGSEPGNANVTIYLAARDDVGKPSAWIVIGTQAALGIAPGSMRVVGPIVLPAANILSPGAYALIAMAAGALDPAPDFSSLSASTAITRALSDAGNVGVRRLNVAT